MGQRRGGNLTAHVSCLELPVPEPEEQSRPRKPTLQPVLQLKARRRLDKVSIAPHQEPRVLWKAWLHPKELPGKSG